MPIVLVFNVAKITNGMNAANVLGQANFTDGDPKTSRNGLWNPDYVTYDLGSDRLFVSDWDDNRVMIFESDTNSTRAQQVTKICKTCAGRARCR